MRTLPCRMSVKVSLATAPLIQCDLAVVQSDSALENLLLKELP